MGLRMQSRSRKCFNQSEARETIFVERVDPQNTNFVDDIVTCSYCQLPSKYVQRAMMRSLNVKSLRRTDDDRTMDNGTCE